MKRTVCVTSQQAAYGSTEIAPAVICMKRNAGSYVLSQVTSVGFCRRQGFFLVEKLHHSSSG